MSKRLHRLKVTGSPVGVTPFEKAREEEETLERYAFYSSDITDLLIFDVRKHGSTGFCFYWKDPEDEFGTGDAVRVGAEHLHKLPSYIERFSELRHEYSSSLVSWQNGAGFDRISNEILEMDESDYGCDFEDYIQDLNQFEGVLRDEEPSLFS